MDALFPNTYRNILDCKDTVSRPFWQSGSRAKQKSLRLRIAADQSSSLELAPAAHAIMGAPGGAQEMCVETCCSREAMP